MSRRIPQSIFGAIQKFLSVDITTKLAIYRHYDDYTFKQMYADRKKRAIVKKQTIDVKEHASWGSDIAVSRFVLWICRGSIKDNRGQWITNPRELPQDFDPSFKLTAINASKAQLLTEGVDNFVGLDRLESLDLSENPDLDDFACDQLARQFRKSLTLKEINLSNNPHISIHGLEVLFRIPSINRIVATNTRASGHDQVDLFVMAAEDERQCQVLLHEDGKQYKNIVL